MTFMKKIFKLAIEGKNRDRFGPTQEAAEVVHFATLTGLMDTVAQAGGEQFYVEILAKHGHRQARPEGATDRVTSAAASATYLDDPQ